jgi:hypothetical protein
MALDAGAKPPLVWLGADSGTLLRIEDQGGKFESRKVNTGGFGTASFEDLSVDRFRPDREVYFRTGQGSWMRFNEDSGQTAPLRLELPSAAGSCLSPGPDGRLYLPAYSHHLLRFTRDGKPDPWPEGNVGYPESAAGKDGKPGKFTGPKHGIYVPVSMIFMTHTLGIRHDGHLFMFEPGHPGDRPPKMLREYTPDGRRVSETPIIWKVSDTAIGPKFDPQGNIYVAEVVRPLDQLTVPEYAGAASPVKLGATVEGAGSEAVCSYGSILKFSPKGGAIEFPGVSGTAKEMVEPKPYQGEMRLDPSLKAVDMAAVTRHHAVVKAKVTGALWAHFGIGHVELTYCNCENTRFDVDWYGRVWYPDLGRQRVGVLDTNGNEIAHFGGYGNVDDPMPDAESGMRDAEGRTSRIPHPEPRIGFTWLIGVGATDKYVYMGDSMNQRLLRAKITCAAEELCEVK